MKNALSGNKAPLDIIRLLVFSLLLVTPLAYAQSGDTLALKAGHPKTYVVVKGDTLWAIAGVFLQSPWKWPEIWHRNRQIDNPDKIYPGDVLNLVYIDGQPKLVLNRNKDIKLTPRVRISELDLAIPAIPLGVISPFLIGSRVVDQGVLKSAPYVLAGKDGSIVSGAGDQLFARGEFTEQQDSYGIFRPGQTFIDPETGEVLGYQAVAIASAQLIALTKDVATLALNQTTQEVRRSDRLLEEEERIINSNFHPSAPESDISGYIIAVEGGVSQIGSMNAVVLNRGLRDGLDIGHVLAIFKVGEQVRDPGSTEIVKVPDSREGILMVFRSFEKVSYALVLKASKPLSVMDRVENP
jgi:hypothetical protein